MVMFPVSESIAQIALFVFTTPAASLVVTINLVAPPDSQRFREELADPPVEDPFEAPLRCCCRFSASAFTSRSCCIISSGEGFFQCPKPGMMPEAPYSDTGAEGVMVVGVGVIDPTPAP